jgi:hypothetical protein
MSYTLQATARDENGAIVSIVERQYYLNPRQGRQLFWAMADVSRIAADPITMIHVAANPRVEVVCIDSAIRRASNSN